MAASFGITSPGVPLRVQAGALMLVIAFALLAPLHVFTPARAKAHTLRPPVQVGTSFSARRAAELGLDYRTGFQRLEALHFRVIRLSAYWNEVDQFGYGDLDWLMAEAEHSRQPVVLAVGMKGLGWPEFYIPAGAMPPGGMREGHDVAEEPGLRASALLFVAETVTRYRENPALVAWQVENEPFNRAGPQRWWIDRGFLQEEIAAVRSLDDRDRPVIVNAFGHFNLLFDQASSRNGFDFKNVLGFDGDSAERQSLAVLRPGDILGLDVYTAIGYRFLGQDHLSRADVGWPDQIGRWRLAADDERKQAWITEAQAEPWEASPKTYTDPRSISPSQIASIFSNLKDAGYKTILLWGSEYWLWRADNADPSWLETVQQILRGETKAPQMALPL